MTDNNIHNASYEAAKALHEVVADELHPSVQHIFFNECYRIVKEAIEAACRTVGPRIEPSVN